MGKRNEEFQSFRNRFLDSLCEPIELYSEVTCRNSIPYFIHIDGRKVGYLLLGEGEVLHEFFMVDRSLSLADEVFSRILEDLDVKKAVCQSWDHLFMSMCLLHFNKRKVMGYNFRDRIEPPGPIPEFDLKERKATLDDIELLERYRDGIFDDNEVKEIPYWIENGECIIYEDISGNFIGYGMMNRTIDGRDWFDIGMYVNPDHRKQGYGTWIIDRLADHCVMNGWRPTLGCGKENAASKKTIEKAGFVSKHVITEFWN
jgi:GNAT superfamily N-acetyltransferase